MRQEHKQFFDLTRSAPFVDITGFWNIPTEQILEEVRSVPDEYWRRPFNIDSNQLEEMNLDDKESVNYYPGLTGDKILAHGWKSLCFLNETGDSKDQISRFPPVFASGLEYRQTLNSFLENRKWTNVSAFSPTLVEFFTTRVYPYMHVGQIFVTRLDGGGVITEHSDIPEESKHLLDNDGVVHMFDMLNTFNLCLNHVESCYSVFDDKVLPGYPGALMWTNVGKRHWVVNMNRQPQYKVIWQGIYKTRFRSEIQQFLTKE
jgi:hypothetical protein